MRTNRTSEEVKAMLLLAASQKPVRRVCQYDGWATGEPFSAGYSPAGTTDADGDWVCGGDTNELRRNDIPVRVQIMAGTSLADALRLLKKITEWIEREPELLLQATQPAVTTAEANNASF